MHLFNTLIPLTARLERMSEVSTSYPLTYSSTWAASHLSSDFLGDPFCLAIWHGCPILYRPHCGCKGPNLQIHRCCPPSDSSKVANFFLKLLPGLRISTSIFVSISYSTSLYLSILNEVCLVASTLSCMTEDPLRTKLSPHLWFSPPLRNPPVNLP